MIDHRERVAEAVNLAASEFGVKDREAVELLLAARIPCGIPYPWIVLETPYYRLDPSGSWFACLFDRITVLPLLRTMRPRASNSEIVEILRGRETPRLFIEPNWELPTTVHYNLKMLPYLTQECVRLKTGYPKGALPGYRSVQLLETAVVRVLDTRWRTAQPELPATPPPLPYWCELLQKLSPPLRDWESLLGNLCALAGRRAYLFDRRVDSTDWSAVNRLMRDSIPAWTKEMLGHLGSRGGFKSLRGKYSRALIEKELERLLKEGVLINHRGDWLLRDSAERGADLQELLAGNPQIC